MPRYYFHLRVGARAELDAEGVECADLSAAKRHAIEIAGARVGAAPRASDDSAGWRIEIADAGGQYLAAIDADGVIAQ